MGLLVLWQGWCSYQLGYAVIIKHISELAGMTFDPPRWTHGDVINMPIIVYIISYIRLITYQVPYYAKIVPDNTKLHYISSTLLVNITNASDNHIELPPIGGYASDNHIELPPIGGYASDNHIELRPIGGYASDNHIELPPIGSYASDNHIELPPIGGYHTKT